MVNGARSRPSNSLPQFGAANSRPRRLGPLLQMRLRSIISQRAGEPSEQNSMDAGRLFDDHGSNPSSRSTALCLSDEWADAGAAESRSTGMRGLGGAAVGLP